MTTLVQHTSSSSLLLSSDDDLSPLDSTLSFGVSAGTTSLSPSLSQLVSLGSAAFLPGCLTVGSHGEW